MTHISPGATLSWAIYSVVFETFLLYHLYQYDGFKCLRWSASGQPGTFKRFMTYSYLSTLPLLILYSVSMSSIKYREGYIDLPFTGIVPKPFELWSEPAQLWITPLFFVFAIAWAFEMITHLEELNFWIFLLRQGTTPRSWFSSIEFKAWLGGSFVAIVGMPLVVGFTRSDPLKCEAWVFFAGSIGSTSVSIIFLYVLYQFPKFLQRITIDGAEPAVVGRLASFHQLNIVRVAVRFLFTVPLFVLAFDGIREHVHPINESSLWTDLLVMVSGLACIISSGITLLIFFPIETPVIEIAKQPEGSKSSFFYYEDGVPHPDDPFGGDRMSWVSNIDDRRPPSYPTDVYYPPPRNSTFGGSEVEMDALAPSHARKRLTPPLVIERTNATTRHSQQLHPYISHFTSPIDLADIPLDLPRAV